MASTDATAIPVKNQAYRVTFPIMDADGDLVTGATGLDSEVSKDAGTFVDVTAEATEIATNSGIYYLDLTATEMNADTVAIIVKTTSSGAKTTVIVLYPQEAGDINVDVTYWNGTAVATPDTAGYPKVTNKSGTGTGELNLTSGVIDSNVTKWSGTAVAAVDTAGYPKVTIKDGTGTGELDTASGRVLSNVVYWNGAAVATPDTAGHPKVTLKAGTGSGELSFTSGVVQADMAMISADAVAANNAESFFDGTGYAGTNNVIPTVTTVGTLTTYTGNTPQTGDSFARIGATGSGLTTLATAANLSTANAGIVDVQARIPAALTAGGNIKADALALSGDTVAADNAEAFFDGTGYAGTNNVIPTVTTITNSVVAGSLGATAKSDVNAEVLDVMSVDTFAELSTIPGTSPTFLQKLQYIYEATRNKLTQTATTQLLFKNDSSTTLGTHTVSDDGTTFTRTRSS